MARESMLQAFYPHQTLLVTGASGFVGKVLLAQLLKACPVKKVYVLLRPSAGRSAQERLLLDVFRSPAFDEMRNKYQEEGGWDKWVSERVVAVPGDLLKPDFGIQNKHTIRKLQEEVTVVIHLAASVHFNSPLKDNYRSNVEGTMRILDFAKGCPYLQVFVHTSACYANSDHEGRVKEDILPLPWDTEELLTAVHKMIELRDHEARHPQVDVAKLEKQLLGRFPNTYTFTKRLSEALLIRDWEKALIHPEKSEVKFPLCMLRPSIVGAAYKHPRRGWIDNLNATGGMFLLCALGVLKCLPANPNLIGDNVPVDVVADALIVSGAAVAAAHAYANPTALATVAHPAAAASLAAAKCVLPQYLPHAIILPKNISPASSPLPSPASADAHRPERATDSVLNKRSHGAPGVYVIHCCTSDTNPVRWGDILYYGREYNMMNPFFNRITRDLQTPYFEGDFDDFRRKFFFLQRLPAAVTAAITSYLLPASSSLKRNANMYHSGIKKVEKAAEAFHPFSYHEWVFEQNNMRKLQHLLAPEERGLFLLRTEDLDWRSWTHYFFYGIARWLLKEQSGKLQMRSCEPPPAPYVYVNLLYKHVLNEPYNPPPFLARLMPYPDAVTFLKNAGPLPRCPSPWSIENAVMGSKALASVIRKDAILLSKQGRRKRRKNAKPAGTTLPEIEAEVREDAQELYESVAGTIKHPPVYLLGGILHTAFLRLFDRVVVERTEVERLKKAVRESRGPVILLPTHRSYMDFLVLFYMCLGNGVPLPFVATDESLAQIAVVNRLLRNVGVFFLRSSTSFCRSRTGSPSLRLYCTVLQQYIQAIAKRHGFLQCFIEGDRSKTGLLGSPQHGLLRMVLDLYFNCEQPNITFVPITISYDKVLEAESFPQELLGGHKPKAGLRRVLNAIRSTSGTNPDCKVQDAENDRLQQRFGVGSKPLGSAYIKIATPISFKLTEDFADHLMGVLSSNLIISPTSLVATILCMHRNGIREEDLEDQVQWLRDQVLLRGGFLSPGVGGLMFDVRLIVQAALQTYLRGVVTSSGGGWSVIQSLAAGALAPSSSGSATSGALTTMTRPTTAGGTVVGPVGADAPRLVLAYYRNECCHLFILEAIVCAALFASGHDTAWEQGAEGGALTEKAVFLMELLKGHFAMRNEMKETEIPKIIDRMVSRRILRCMPSPSATPSHSEAKGERRYVFHPTSESTVTLFTYFVWPFVDSYWACGMGLFALQKPETPPDSTDNTPEDPAADRDPSALATPLSRARTQMTKAQLVARAHWLADGLYKENYVALLDKLYTYRKAATISGGTTSPTGPNLFLVKGTVNVARYTA
ncbi:hypothetical protein BESB_065680 [Besnoitia besnoiti]|uniref:Phospholipid/glycerol acyltransferase domain-containing protein n=1 Tax=Besnoitia besnoiti TaxID=94643 RepID=A0A2A9M962_BESBE|nr:hypothetical protein BESB_065680 [Besnoitia besnoiti]PFH34535.1 hypothetical protein BESB_065680 [Besnoitia besnoiti]